MQLGPGILRLSFWVCICTLLALSASAQLIEPTRTLTSEPLAKSTLTVLSEPPGLKVMLDSKALGATPIFSATVDPGSHVLQVNDKQTSLQIVAGKSIRVALFKGSFIELPEQKEPELSQKSRAEEASPPAKPQTQPPKETIHTSDPFYWPLNPRGPIY